MKRYNVADLLGAVLIIAPVMAAFSTGQARAETSTATFVPFHEFIQAVKGTQAADVLARPAAQVKDTVAVEEMRQHILKMYNGVNVSHSYVLDSQTYDCIPVEEQPSVRALGLTRIASTPPRSAAISAPANDSQAEAGKLSQLPEGRTHDEFGNALGCEDHTIPMSRITLEQLSRFENLHEFFQKGPNGSGHPLEHAQVVPPATAAHKYSFTYQYVNNLGPSTNINLWRPYIYTDLSEIFTLAQLWTIGEGSAPTQTAEAGWQNYPALYGTQNSALFIYWTADGYNKTGCYNLTCAGFVQTSSSVHFGAGFSNYSVFDGSQWEVRLQYYLYQGNWWLGYNGSWVGYYPASIYNGGQLSKYSNLLEFGSESVGTTVWPMEGSGLWSSNGSGYAAYQRMVYYVNTSGTSVWASLTADSPSPACYTASNPAYSSSWGEYFYFGGPGGASCQ